MEWAKPREILTGFFQTNVFAHHADNVRLLLYRVCEIAGVSHTLFESFYSRTSILKTCLSERSEQSSRPSLPSFPLALPPHPIQRPLELGPGAVLAGLAGRIVAGAEVNSISDPSSVAKAVTRLNA
jgi:hypothetical protein